MKSFLLALAVIVASLPDVSLACEKHAKQTKESKAPLAGDSIYHSGSKWRDPSANEIQLNHFRGKTVILAMAYTKCTYTCPMTIAKLKEIENDLIAKKITDYEIVVASFDPTNDNPERLAQYSKEKNLGANWTMLSPKSDKDVRQLAALLGITYSKDKKGDYAHSNIITLLDTNGVIRDRLPGLASDHTQLITNISLPIN